MNAPVRIVQLTDPHLVTEPDGRVHEVPTRDAFVEALAHAAGDPDGVDYLVLTGDLAQDEALPTYEALRELLAEWEGRYFMVPGNHDNPEHMARVFPDRFVPHEGKLDFRFDAGRWRVLGLDTHWRGEVPGRLEPAQLEWLDAELGSLGDRRSVLFLHHPPVEVDLAWMDELMLQEPERLNEIIAASPGLALVCCGHVHMDYEVQVGDARVCTTPSTAFQFGRVRDAQLDLVPAGYRRIELDGATCTTRVERLPALRFVPG